MCLSSRQHTTLRSETYLLLSWWQHALGRVSTYHLLLGLLFLCLPNREDLRAIGIMVPGLGLFRKRSKGAKGSKSEAVAPAQEGVLQVPDAKGSLRREAPAGINDSVHSLHNLDTESRSDIPKKSPPAPPSPTSILPNVDFLELSGSGSDGKGSEPSSISPDEQHSLTADDPEWAWHEPPSEVDPKDAATPDR